MQEGGVSEVRQWKEKAARIMGLEIVVGHALNC